MASITIQSRFRRAFKNQTISANTTEKKIPFFQKKPVRNLSPLPLQNLHQVVLRHPLTYELSKQNENKQILQETIYRLRYLCDNWLLLVPMHWAQDVILMQQGQ